MLFLLTMLACEPLGPVHVDRTSPSTIITEEYTKADEIPTLTNVDILTVHECYEDEPLQCQGGTWYEQDNVITIPNQGDITRIMYMER